MPNRLAQESSPYLLQHQNNPVDWYPWGDEALSRARTENKPILLSIGYSACHWCHVMEGESFENPEIARLMNENFINIKVDREERPDLDRIYQNVAQALTRGGGWPLTVFLTPELRPYFGGTYFPPEDRWGRPGFPKVLQAISDAFHQDREGVAGNATKLTEFIAAVESVKVGPGREPTQELLQSLASAIHRAVDRRLGGLSGAPKFPNPMLFSYLWRMGIASNQADFKEDVLVALTAMASGGIYDQLGGGFHRYSVDESWSVPHFEKMLYDNGLLLKLYSEVLLSKDPAVSVDDSALYTRIVDETVDYLTREMQSQEGGFYSAQDADTEGEEGKYFVWDPADLKRELNASEARVFSLRYGVAEGGNFEHGKTVLHLAKTMGEVVAESGLSEVEVRLALGSAKGKLLEARAKRVAPSRDDKVLAAWNGLVISGLAWAAQALKQAGQDDDAIRARKAAMDAMSFVEKKMSRDRDRLWSTAKEGKAKLNAYLDDYAFLAMAALDLARFSESSAEAGRWTELAASWMSTVIRHFKDLAAPGYFFTSDDHEALIQRPKSVFDQAIPSGAGVVLTCLAALAELDPAGKGSEFEKELMGQLPALFGVAAEAPHGCGEMLSAALLWTLGPIAVSGKGSSEAIRHAHAFQKAAPETPGLVCHKKACSPPLGAPGELQSLIQEKTGFPGVGQIASRKSIR